MRSIDADKLKEALKNRHYNPKSWNQLFSAIMETIDNAPTIEPERPEGEWEERTDFCPNCGAKLHETGAKNE